MAGIEKVHKDSDLQQILRARTKARIARYEREGPVVHMARDRSVPLFQTEPKIPGQGWDPAAARLALAGSEPVSAALAADLRRPQKDKGPLGAW